MKLWIFTSKTCSPCRTLKTSLASFDLSIPVKYKDVVENQKEAFDFRVRSLPTLCLVDENNALIATHSGLIPPTSIQEFIDEHSS